MYETVDMIASSLNKNIDLYKDQELHAIDQKIKLILEVISQYNKKEIMQLTTLIKEYLNIIYSNVYNDDNNQQFKKIKYCRSKY